MSANAKRAIWAIAWIVFSAIVILLFKTYVAPALCVDTTYLYFCYPILIFSFIFVVTRKCWLEVWC